jgi:hypothetical protein
MKGSLSSETSIQHPASSNIKKKDTRKKIKGIND